MIGVKEERKAGKQEGKKARRKEDRQEGRKAERKEGRKTIIPKRCRLPCVGPFLGTLRGCRPSLRKERKRKGRKGGKKEER